MSKPLLVYNNNDNLAEGGGGGEPGPSVSFHSADDLCATVSGRKFLLKARENRQFWLESRGGLCLRQAKSNEPRHLVCLVQLQSIRLSSSRRRHENEGAAAARAVQSVEFRRALSWRARWIASTQERALFRLFAPGLAAGSFCIVLHLLYWLVERARRAPRSTLTQRPWASHASATIR